MYQFKYALNESDYFEFNKFHMFNSPSGKKNIIMLRVFLPLLFVIMLLVSFSDYEDKKEFIYLCVGYAIVSAIWCFIVKPLYFIILKSNLKRIKKDGSLPYGKEVSIKFDDECFIEDTDQIETKIQYSKVERIALGYAIYIYFSAIQASIVPFSAFENNREREEFLSFLNSKVENAKQLQPGG